MYHFVSIRSTDWKIDRKSSHVVRYNDRSRGQLPEEACLYHFVPLYRCNSKELGIMSLVASSVTVEVTRISRWKWKTWVNLHAFRNHARLCNFYILQIFNLTFRIFFSFAFVIYIYHDDLYHWINYCFIYRIIRFFDFILYPTVCNNFEYIIISNKFVFEFFKYVIFFSILIKL